MAKAITIHFSDLTGAEPGRVDLHKGPVVSVDLSLLEDHYRQMGERHLANAREFMDYWRDEGESLFLKPRARVVLVDGAHCRKAFGETFHLAIQEGHPVALAVWTLGVDLEKASSAMTATNGERMKGLFLDVAGSMALFAVHDGLLDWLRQGEARRRSLSLVDEFYPGFNGVNATLMEQIEALGRTKETIGVESRGEAMLYPRKSQCSFIAFGKGPDGTLKNPEPCDPCLGRRCLYYQIGGCHLTAKGQKP